MINVRFSLLSAFICSSSLFSIPPPPPPRSVGPAFLERGGKSIESIVDSGIGVFLAKEGSLERAVVVIPDWNNEKINIALHMTAVSPDDLEHLRVGLVKSTRLAFPVVPGHVTGGGRFLLRVDFSLRNRKKLSVWVFEGGSGIEFYTVPSSRVDRMFRSADLAKAIGDIVRRKPADGSPNLPTLDLDLFLTIWPKAGKASRGKGK